MGPIEGPTYGYLKYADPDPDDLATERGFYSFPPNRTVKVEKQQLHDIRTSPNIIQGPEGLDTQGFTWLSHKSTLSGNAWFAPGNAEKVYAAEVSDIIRSVTGANRVVVDGMSFRRRAPKDQDQDPNFVLKRGCDLDVAISKMSPHVMRVTGRDQGSSAEPARQLHVDYSEQGLRDTARYGREEIANVARANLDAEDRGEHLRYAVYSVWRPLNTVKKDPLAVLDWRTVDETELIPLKSRALSGVNKNGEYLREGLIATPPKNPEAHRWYWIPEQKSDEVLIIKFADTAASANSGIAAHCVHGAARLEDVESENKRESIECRVMAFWD